MIRQLIIGLLLTTLGQILIWFQVNGQFMWKWFKDNTFIVALTMGTAISYIFIWGTRYMVNYFNGTIWESKLIGFGIGIVTFSLLTYKYMGEGLNAKTAVSIVLATALVCIQIFWK